MVSGGAVRWGECQGWAEEREAAPYPASDSAGALRLRRLDPGCPTHVAAATACSKMAEDMAMGRQRDDQLAASSNCCRVWGCLCVCGCVFEACVCAGLEGNSRKAPRVEVVVRRERENPV